MLEKSLRFLRHMIAIHETIVSVVMTESGHYDCKLFEVAQPELDRETVRTVLHEQVRHLSDVQVVQVVVIAQVVRIVDRPDSLQCGSEDGGIYLRERLQIVGNESLRQSHKRGHARVALRDHENVQVYAANVQRLQLHVESWASYSIRLAILINLSTFNHDDLNLLVLIRLFLDSSSQHSSAL